MSVPVAVEELADAVARFGPVAYLLTTGEDGRPHATHADVSVDGSTVSCGIGRKTARNAAAQPLVSFVWPPVEKGGYSLIVDGSIEVTGSPGEDAVGTTTVTSAILHRPAAGPSVPRADGSCDADCADVDLPS
jgi:hypothetical protein